MSELRSRAEAGIAQIAAAGTSWAEVGTAPEGPPPDSADSGIEADLKAAVHVAWSRVMGEVEYVKKGRSQGLNYEFRGIDAVLNAVGPALRKHGVLVFPVKVSPEYTVVTSAKGAVMNYCRCVVRYIIMGPRGDVLTIPDDKGGNTPLIIETMGEAFDTGDKASTKAQSVSLRTFYINTLAIATNEPARDPEHGVQHEMGAPPRPTAAQYAEWIYDDRTSIARLRQIRDELDGDAAMSHTVVEGLDGEHIELGQLVRRVGAARMAKGN